MPYLLDSLYRGYPVGALIWKTQLDVPLRAADVLQGEHTYERALLLDGWQRPTSLAKVMKPEVVKGPVLDVRFDLRTETFLNPSAVQRKDALLIKVSDVLQESPQFASMLLAIGLSYESPDFDEYYRRLQKVYSIRKYPMPILTVESDDCEEVAEIFAASNRVVGGFLRAIWCTARSPRGGPKASTRSRRSAMSSTRSTSLSIVRPCCG